MIWSEFDPAATQLLPAAQLPHLLRKVDRPLGIKGAPLQWAVRLSLNLGLGHTKGKLSFQEVLNALVSHNYHTQMKDSIPDSKILSGQKIPVAMYHSTAAAAGQLWRRGELRQPQIELSERFAKMLLQLHVRRAQTLALEPLRRAQTPALEPLRRAQRLRR